MQGPGSHEESDLRRRSLSRLRRGISEGRLTKIESPELKHIQDNYFLRIKKTGIKKVIHRLWKTEKE